MHSSIPAGRVGPLKTSSVNNYKDQSKKESSERKRNLLHLIWKYLNEQNFTKSADCLEDEAGINLQYEVCDNIDLEVILQEYQSYYSVKFHKEPKILKKILPITDQNKLKKTKPKSAKNSIENSEKDKIPKLEKNDSFDFEIISLGPVASSSNLENNNPHQSRINQPLLSDFEEYSSDWGDLANIIKQQIVPKNSVTSWQDCIGLEPTIELIKEATIYPIKYPQLFENIPKWNGILLYGPPGTGKTLLAKALSSEQELNVINVTGSTFISKWRGESEKLLKILFDVAKLYKPSVIFIDEIDSLINRTEISQHEASRRFTSEFLTQLDGLLTCKENVFVLATTNHPWNLEPALVRRFEKRILIDLPDNQTRYAIFNHYLERFCRIKLHSKDVQQFCDQTSNYSAADIKTVCKEVEMSIIREKIHEIQTKDWNKQCTKQINRKLGANDVEKAIRQSKSSIDDDLYEKYLKWDCRFSSK